MTTNSSDNPYATPGSSLHEPRVNSGALSVEEALARDYDFRIGEVLGEAWHKVKGMKGTLIGAVLIYGVAINVISFVIAFVLGLLGLFQVSHAGTQVLEIVVNVFAGALCYPLLAGLNLIGTRRAADQPAEINEMFSHFGLFMPLFITGLGITALIYLGMFLLLLPGIYLGVAYSLAVPLLVERNLSPWQAMEASRKAISGATSAAIALRRRTPSGKAGRTAVDGTTVPSTRPMPLVLISSDAACIASVLTSLSKPMRKCSSPLGVREEWMEARLMPWRSNTCSRSRSEPGRSSGR